MMDRIDDQSIEKGETDLEDRDELFDMNKINGEFQINPHSDDVEDDQSEEIVQNEPDTEYERLMYEMHLPPTSQRKNAPLNEYHSKMPKLFKKDALYEVKNDDTVYKVSNNIIKAFK